MPREISEHEATVAVDAAARKIYADYIGRQEREMAEDPRLVSTGITWKTFDDLSPSEQLELRQTVLPIVWVALGSLPDQRHAAYEEGWAKAWSPLSPHDLEDSHNPYPAQEA